MESLIQKMKKSPLENMSPEMKKNLTPQSLKAMNFCGIMYFFVMATILLTTALFVTIPVAYIEDPSLLFSRKVVVTIMYLLIMVNLYFLSTCDSLYKSNGLLDMLPDASWKKCIDCNHNAPPRSHHCPLCRSCVMKRDHHCFFTGSCVGFRNQRFFVTFCFHCAVAAGFVMYCMYQYFVKTYHTEAMYHIYDYFLPVTVVQWICGYQTFGFLCLLVQGYLCAMSGMGAAGLMCWQFFIMALGVTTHEYLNNVNTYRTLNFLKNYREALGPNWLVHFIFPMPWIKLGNNGTAWNAAKLM